MGLVSWCFKKSCINYALILCLYMVVRQVSSVSEEVLGVEENIIERYKIAKFNFDHVSGVYTITLWILLGSLAKICKLKQKSSFLYPYIF